MLFPKLLNVARSRERGKKPVRIPRLAFVSPPPLTPPSRPPPGLLPLLTLHTIMAAFALLTATPLLAIPQAVPVPEKTAAAATRDALKGEHESMHAWYCGQPGNDASLPCLVQQLRTLPAQGPERDALQAKIREAPKGKWGRGGGGKGEGELGPQGRDIINSMHEGWYA